MIQLRLVNGSLLLFQRILLPPRQRHGPAGRQGWNRGLTRARGRTECATSKCSTCSLLELERTVKEKFNLRTFDLVEWEREFFANFPKF